MRANEQNKTPILYATNQLTIPPPAGSAATGERPCIKRTRTREHQTTSHETKAAAPTTLQGREILACKKDEKQKGRSTVRAGGRGEATQESAKQSNTPMVQNRLTIVTSPKKKILTPGLLLYSGGERILDGDVG